MFLTVTNLFLLNNCACALLLTNGLITYCGVPAVAQWVKNPTAVAWVALEAFVRSPTCSGLKDLTLPQPWHRSKLQLRFNPWPWNFHMLQLQP